MTYGSSGTILFDLEYVSLGGSFRLATGCFRDRSQVAARLTLPLN